MKNRILFLFFLFSVYNLLNFNFQVNAQVFSHEFATEPRPRAIIIDQNKNYIFIVNNKSTINNPSKKIQQFTFEGTLIQTIADYQLDDIGFYPHYSPRDITINKDNKLFVLLRAYDRIIAGGWFPRDGFCIMEYDLERGFQKELDFTYDKWYPNVLEYRTGFLFVADDTLIKKINIENENVQDITISSEISKIYVSDMVTDEQSNIWLVGPAYFSGYTTGCQINYLNLNSDIFTFFSKRNYPIQYSLPNNPGIYLDSNDKIYVVTFYGQDIEIFDSFGNYLSSFDLSNNGYKESRPIDIVVDRCTNMYVLDYGYNLVRVFKQSELSNVKVDIQKESFPLLNSNFPNPFNTTTSIRYQIFKSSKVKLEVWNYSGQLVKRLITEKQNIGIYKVQWNGKNEYGIDVASGIFILQLSVNNYIFIKKMLLLR